jgi:hypothetical protein
MDYLQQIWNRYKKPIWLTEFACPQDKSADDQLQFMKAILPRLESASYVFRYSWFVSRNTENLFTTKAVSLLHQNSQEMIKESCPDPQNNRTRTSNRIVHESKNPINNRTQSINQSFI